VKFGEYKAWLIRWQQRWC